MHILFNEQAVYRRGTKRNKVFLMILESKFSLYFSILKTEKKHQMQKRSRISFWNCRMNHPKDTPIL